MHIIHRRTLYTKFFQDKHLRIKIGKRSYTMFQGLHDIISNFNLSNSLLCDVLEIKLKCCAALILMIFILKFQKEILSKKFTTNSFLHFTASHLALCTWPTIQNNTKETWHSCKLCFIPRQPQQQKRRLCKFQCFIQHEGFLITIITKSVLEINLNLTNAE